MKIGVFTFHYPYNYGAMLQAYALQTYLTSQGHDVEFIDYRIAKVDEQYRVFWKPYTYIDGFHKSLLHPFFRMLNSLKDIRYSIKRKQGFKSFPKLLNLSSKEYNLNTYDVIICGSDQIWDPMHTYGFDKNYWGEYEEFNGKVIAYAPSMGKYELGLQDHEIIKRFLGNFDYLSIRDARTKNICKSYTNAYIEEVVDPTFLLSVSDWDAFSDDSIVDYPFILLYDLNNEDELVYSKITELQKRYNYKVIELKVNNYSNKHAWCEIYNAGPKQFLGLIKQASIIVTSSFHATVFSIIFHKEVYTSFTTRIYDLLTKLDLEERIITESNFHSCDKQINYEIVDKGLKDRIESSKRYLLNALGDSYGLV